MKFLSYSVFRQLKEKYFLFLMSKKPVHLIKFLGTADGKICHTCPLFERSRPRSQERTDHIISFIIFMIELLLEEF
jgi:hypothetical protein